MELICSIREDKFLDPITLNDLEYIFSLLINNRATISGALDLDEYFLIMKKWLTEKRGVTENKFNPKFFWEALDYLTQNPPPLIMYVKKPKRVTSEGYEQDKQVYI